MKVYTIELNLIVCFEWDEGNSRKSADKHHVNQAEAESVFFNNPLIVVEDEKHSGGELRYNALGRTSQDRLLHVTFTLRRDRPTIRVISERDIYRKEGRAEGPT